jgi:signal transduction histidine kinase/DNA-binding response OmpR family regulator
MTYGETKQPPGGPLGRLVVVDDENELVKALQEAIAEEGYEACGFTTASEALAKLKENDFDILLTDLKMPVMDGLELFRQAREIDPYIVGIVMTGHATVGTALEAMKGGVYDYLMKPFKAASLVPLLDRAMAMRRLSLENVELRQTLAMYELGQTISSSLALSTILDKVTDGALQQCAADEASVMLLSPGGDELRIAAVRGKDRTSLLGQRAPVGKYVAGWVAARKEPLMLQGSIEDPRYAPLNRRSDIHLAVSLPLVVGGKLVGVMNVNFTHPRRPLTLGELKALNIFSSIAAASIESAQSHEVSSKAEEEIRSLARFPGENPNPVMRVSAEGILVYGNPASRPLMESWSCSVGEKLPEEHRLLILKAMLQGKPELIELVCRNLIYSVVFAPVAEAGYLNIYALEITQQKSLEAQLLQSQKMDAIGQLAGGVAHDFNNILTAIMGYADFLRMRMGVDNPLCREVGEINKAAQRAASLTQQLLAFSRRQVFQLKVLDLNALITGMQKMLQRLVNESIAMEVHLDPSLGRLLADATQLEQILLNLVINARDAMAQGGKLLIETSNVELDEGYARMHMSVKPGPYIQLVVSDTGIGMDEDIRRHLFEPFFTTKEQGKGTGLGLSMVFGIVKQSGGNIWVYSEPGAGTSFKIYFPRVYDSIENTALESTKEDLLRGSETILVVEDETMIREIIGITLVDRGFTVLAAQNGDEALRISEEHPGPIHLLLCDVILPGASGREVARMLAARRSDIRVIYMSGYTSNAIVHHGVLEKGVAFLQKPFSPGALLEKVRKVLGMDTPPAV